MIFFIVFVFVDIIQPTNAADVLIQINGTVVSSGCSVATGTAEQYVDLGRWPTSQFTEGTTTGPVAFTINLENCNGASSKISGVSVAFSGAPDTANSNLLALNGDSTASNVGIAILDEDKNIITPGEASEVYPLETDSSTATLVFYGQYVATANNVTAGTANSDATFTLTYQ